MPCALTAVCETVCSDGDWKRMGSGCYSNVGLWGLLSSLCFLQCSHAAFMFVSKGGASRCLGAAVWALPIWLFSFLCTVWSPQPMCVPTGTHAHARVHTPTHTHTPFFFFKIFFLCEPFFKVFIESITTLLLFYVLDFWPQGMWALSSPIRAWLTHCAMWWQMTLGKVSDAVGTAVQGRAGGVCVPAS